MYILPFLSLSAIREEERSVCLRCDRERSIDTKSGESADSFARLCACALRLIISLFDHLWFHLLFFHCFAENHITNYRGTFNRYFLLKVPNYVSR